MKNKVLIIVNPYASNGRGLTFVPTIKLAAQKHWKTVEVIITKKIEDVPIALEKAYTEAFDTILAVGGDGTNNVILNHLMALREKNPDIAKLIYGTIPAGTGDDWASMLKMPHDPTKAIDWLADREARWIDIGHMQVDDQIRYFLNATSVGAGFEVSQWVDANKSALLPYVQATLRLILRYQAPTLSVSVDGENFYHGAAYLTAVANGKLFAGGMKIAPEAVYDDGLLEVICIEGDSVWTAIKGLAGVFLGWHVRMNKVHIHRGKRITILCDKEVGLEIEGQRERAQRIVCEIMPHAFLMLV